MIRQVLGYAGFENNKLEECKNGNNKKAHYSGDCAGVVSFFIFRFQSVVQELNSIVIN